MAENDKLVNPIPKTCEYLDRFLNGKIKYYRSAKESYCHKIGPQYREFYRERDVMQHYRDVVGGIEDEFYDIRIPEYFSTPDSLLELVRNFRGFLLERKKSLFENIFKHHNKLKQTAPGAVLEAEEINNELIKAFNCALRIARSELSEKAIVASLATTLNEKQKAEKEKQGYLCDDKLEFTNIRAKKSSYWIRINDFSLSLPYSDLLFLIYLARESKENKGGWIPRDILIEVVVEANLDQYLGKLRDKISLALIKKDPLKFIEMSGGKCRLSILPEFITHPEPENKEWLNKKFDEIQSILYKKRDVREKGAKLREEKVK